MSPGIIAGGGLPEGSGWRRWLKMLLRAVFPRIDRRL